MKKKLIVMCFFVMFSGVFVLSNNVYALEENYVTGSKSNSKQEGYSVIRVDVKDNAYIESNKMDASILKVEILEDTPVVRSRAGVAFFPKVYMKTIIVDYSTTNFPAKHYYSEYNYNRWYKGNLSFQSSVRLSNGNYRATYSGALLAQL